MNSQGLVEGIERAIDVRVVWLKPPTSAASSTPRPIIS